MGKIAYASTLVVLAIGVLGLSGCSSAEWVPLSGALVSVKSEAVPTLDGVADDAAWKDAPETIIEVADGARGFTTEVKMRSVYTADTVYFVATWADPTRSFLRSPWEKQRNGTWAQLKDPADKGGDNNLWYEDKFALIWPIDNSMPGFDTRGCALACHPGENPDLKPYGNKYTESADKMGDIWHWKSVRNLGQIDDQYLDSARLDAKNFEETKDAGRHSDPATGGGYVDNKTADGKFPAFMLPAGAAKDGSPGFILDSEKVRFDGSKLRAGDRIPGVVISEIKGDRGDIPAKWKWANGAWTIEFSRRLVTDSMYDVQFDNINAGYYFGAAVFDNAQVRHAYQKGATPLVFKP